MGAIKKHLETETDRKKIQPTKLNIKGKYGSEFTLTLPPDNISIRLDSYGVNNE